jgi:nitrogen regulatory protein PII
MKKIEAILSPHILGTVRELLAARGCHEIVVSEVRSAAGHGERRLRYRGLEYTTGIDLVKLEAVVADQEAMPTAHLILGASHEHGFSDPTVSVSSLEAVFSIGISKLEEKDPSRPMLKVGASLDHGTHAHA